MEKSWTEPHRCMVGKGTEGPGPTVSVHRHANGGHAWLRLALLPYCYNQCRWRGSRMSRRASPRRFVPNTTRLIARPGKITSQGAVRTYSAADSESMRPHEGCGSGMPRPRKESAASTRIAEPSCAVA